jgi:hypothetical protein
MTRPDLPLWLDAKMVELLLAAETFAAIPVPDEAPGDGYVLPSDVRIYAREVRRIRAAVAAVRAEWRD